MRKAIIFLAGVTCATLAVAQNAGIAQAVMQDKPATISQQGDPLQSFEAIAARYKDFFAEPKRFIYSEQFQYSPSGLIVKVAEYATANVAFDVRKTDSLVSPYTAYVQLPLTRSKNTCGTVRLSAGDTAWPDAAGALKEATNDSCFSPLAEMTNTRFEYAYQNNKWAFKQISMVDYNNRPNWTLMSILGVAKATPDVAAVLADNGVVNFNKAWKDLILPQ